ncbi:MAG: hypothetical protein HKN68_22785, partial [Saprospiraceae bacterium]|nr:hypothetical protein [Saprospiraceae bacterium]
MPYILIFLAWAMIGEAQSPHGDSMRMDCAACHNTEGWEIPRESWNFIEEKKTNISSATGIELNSTEKGFNHFDTSFPLTGGHDQVDCRACHASLVFEEVQTDCISCHFDVHNMSVGNDCIRCHNTGDWLIDHIPELHEQNGFPLLGAHDNLSCVDCHQGGTNLNFERIGNECISCHQADFEMTSNPDHISAGFSINCIDCHSPEDNEWDTEAVDHSFFPLTLGHEINDCKRCHTTDNFADVVSDCFSCHQTDFEESVMPDHENAGFEMDCAKCHTADPGWSPAIYSNHDLAFFPIYSGSHEGEWSDCIDCHTDENNFSVFTCISCHMNPDTDDEHEGVAGYIYEDNACLACHPTGESDGAFDHNATSFPLTGSHIGIDCQQCHADGYEGISTECVDCHTQDFEGSQNPNHVELGISTDCASCHTTEPDWMPASFDVHDDYYVLEGAHAMIAGDCVSCHNGDYLDTPTDCVGCHLDDFNNTIDPNHELVGFSTDCASCHSQDAWEPSTFDHDGQYFPIYSGSHEGEWSDCIDCHTDENNFSVFTCISCHMNPDTDDEHEG